MSTHVAQKASIVSLFDWLYIIIITFFLHLKGFCYYAILLVTLQCNYRNKAMQFGINCTPTIETNVYMAN